MWLQQNTNGNAFLSVLNVYVFAALVFINVSFLSVVAISVDRFLAIHLHLRYQELVTNMRVVVVVIFIWALSVFIPIMYFWISAEIAVMVIDVTLVFVLCVQQSFTVTFISPYDATQTKFKPCKYSK